MIILRSLIRLSHLSWGITSSLLLILCFNQPLLSQNLESYQQEAALNNPELRAAWFNYEASLNRIDQAGTLPDPEVGFAYFISPIETRLGPQRARISATQMFPWFGSLSTQKSVNIEESRSRFEIFQDQRNRLFFRMESLWSELIRIDEQIRIAGDNLEIMNTLVQISVQKYETGLVPQIDVLRVQIEEEELKTNIELLKADREIIIRRFNELRNTETASEVILPEQFNIPEVSASGDSLLSMVSDRNPQLEQLRYNEAAAYNRADAASDRGKPSFGIGLDYIATGERTDVTGLTDNGKDALIARLNIKVPLFRKKYNSEVQEARNLAESLKYQRAARVNELETSLITALQDRVDARRLYRLYDEQQIQRVEQAVNILIESYSADNSDFEEILRFYRKLFDYQLKRIEARTQEFKSVSYIRYLTGAHNITEEELNY